MVRRRGFVFVEGLIAMAVMMLLLAIGIATFIHFLVYPLGWLGWIATVAALTFSMMFAFWFVAARAGGPIPGRISSQIPDYDPLLSQSDIAVIKEVLLATPKVDKRILRILLLPDGNAEVQTGFIAGPRSGCGQYVILEQPDWKVLSVRRWVS